MWGVCVCVFVAFSGYKSCLYSLRTVYSHFVELFVDVI